MPLKRKYVRLLVVEDNRLLREGIVRLLAEQTDLKIVGALGVVENILRKVHSLRPDILLLDLGLRNFNSLTLVRSVKKSLPRTKVIAMDLVPMQDDIHQFVQAGVSGFLLKDATLDDFLRTIRLVAQGTKVLPTQLTGSLFTQIIDHAVNGPGQAKVIESVRMTKRERQVIALIAEGMSNKEIAQKLNLSTYTVKSHVHNVLEKLALHTRVQIARYAHTTEGFSDAAASISLLDE